MTGFGIYQDYSTDTAPLIVFRIKLGLQKWALKSGKGPLFMWVDQQVPNLTVCSFELAPSSKRTRESHQDCCFGGESMNQCCFPSGNASTYQRCYRAAALSTAQQQGTLVWYSTDSPTTEKPGCCKHTFGPVTCPTNSWAETLLSI